MTQKTRQYVVVPAEDIDKSQAVGYAAFFDGDGNPIDIGGGEQPAAVTWETLDGKPSTFTPSSHTHAVGDITGLDTALDEKADGADLAALEVRVAALESAAEG